MCLGSLNYHRKSNRPIACRLIALFLTLQFQWGVHCKSFSSHRESDFGDSGLGRLPAPVNVFVNSTNFYDTLIWDPGPGTPEGTQYRIFQSVRGEIPILLNTTAMSLELNLNCKRTYIFEVQASYKWTTSPHSKKVIFTPFTDTKIFPLDLSLVGCSSCLKVNISLPKANPHSTVDIQKLYNPTFTVVWRKSHEKQSVNETRRKTSFTLNNLEQGTEYCVQVHMNTNLNKNMYPSVLKCKLTNPAPSARGFGLVLGLSLGLLTILICILAYAFHRSPPFFWKKKFPQPKLTITTLGLHQDMLRHEKTNYDQLTITSKKENAATMEQNTQIANKGEENAWAVYIGNNLPPSLAGSCSAESSPELDTNHPTLDEEFKERSLECTPVQSEREEPDGRLYKLCQNDDQNTSEQTDEELNEEELFNNSFNVNLRSITLAAPVKGKKEMEEEQNIEHDLNDLFTSHGTEPLSLCYLQRT